MALVTLNRPESANTLNLQMGMDLLAAALACARNAAVRAVVLTGAGRNFCFGGDLRAMASRDTAGDDYIRELTNRLHQHALAAQALQYRTVMPERMRPPRLAEPAQQCVFHRLDKNERRGILSAQLPQERGQIFKLAALARIHQQRRALDFSAGLHVQFTERGN